MYLNFEILLNGNSVSPLVNRFVVFFFCFSLYLLDFLVLFAFTCTFDESSRLREKIKQQQQQQQNETRVKHDTLTQFVRPDCGYLSLSPPLSARSAAHLRVPQFAKKGSFTHTQTHTHTSIMSLSA